MYSIVYKTYKNDVDWLKYSLLSIDKFITDTNYEIVIYYHDECEDYLKSMISSISLKNEYRLIPVNYDINGYLKQMVVKCMCFSDIENDIILIMDSDVILNSCFSYQDMISDDKINWYFLERNDENTKQRWFDLLKFVNKRETFVKDTIQNNLLESTEEHLDRAFIYYGTDSEKAGGQKKNIPQVVYI